MHGLALSFISSHTNLYLLSSSITQIYISCPLLFYRIDKSMSHFLMLFYERMVKIVLESIWGMLLQK